MQVKKSTLWQQLTARVISKNMNEGLEKSSVLNKPLNLGDFIVHSASGLRGTVTSLDRIAGHETLSFVESGSGVLRRGIARQECRLASSEKYRGF